MTNQPEPCYTPGGLHCKSPIACNAFGYCRERNFPAGVPDKETQAEWRKVAAYRKAQSE